MSRQPLPRDLRWQLAPAFSQKLLELELPVEQRALARRELAACSLPGRLGTHKVRDDGTERIDLRLGLAEALGRSLDRRGGVVY